MMKSVCPLNHPIIGADGIMLCDVTLREGESAPGAFFKREDKLELAKALDETGIHQIQFCMVNESEELRESARELCSLGLAAKIELMSNGMKENRLRAIDYLLDCGPDIVHSSFAVTTNMGYGQDEIAPDRLKASIKKVIERIKSYGKAVNISFMDATRADAEYLAELTAWAADAGADRIRLADTAGAVTPEAFYELVSRCVQKTEKTDAIIGVHCHNDFGLALANSLSAVRAGAKLIDVSVNGLGDRSGNTPLAQFAVSLEVLYGNSCGVDLKKMTHLSRLTERFSGIAVPYGEPLVGKYAFSHELDAHIGAQLDNPLAFQCMLPESVGNQTEIIFGKLSGVNSIRWKARESGTSIEQENIPEILRRLSVRAADQTGQVLGDKEFWEIVSEVQ